ncbi:MAG: hypothetical protein M1308_02190 [Actinobacteria bacterium]|nr:hypothetical protein [Actinomycetota bacterium]
MISGYDSVINLAKREKDKNFWLLIIKEALVLSKENKEIRAKWIYNRLEKNSINIKQRPNLRKLSSYRILNIESRSSRGKHAMINYEMLDPQGVEKALKELN